MIQSCAVIMLILSLFNKLCAVFVTIPDPIVGGIYMVMFGEYETSEEKTPLLLTLGNRR